MKPDKNHPAYFAGYDDGYDEGVENNPFDGATQPHDRLQYRWGYDAGVADYCRDHLDTLDTEESYWEEKSAREEYLNG
jgi:hypothetical protein